MRKRINTRNECNGTRTHGNGSSPRYTKVQFAGSMAMLSVGTGWNYYRNHWETDMLLGIVPRNANDHANVTFTLKQNYFPWNIDLGEKVSFEPLCCGIYVNFLFDRDFWAKQPNKYPPGYYWFSTRIRNHIFIGGADHTQTESK